MKTFLFGILAIVIFAATALCGCDRGNGGQGGKPIENSFRKHTLVYTNNTSVVVTLEAYEALTLKESLTIEPGKSLEQVERIGAGSNGKGVMVNDYKTVRVVFGDTKELVFTNSEPDTPYNIFKRANYKVTTLNDMEEKYDYEIGEAMMNAATTMKAARPEGRMRPVGNITVPQNDHECADR